MKFQIIFFNLWLENFKHPLKQKTIIYPHVAMVSLLQIVFCQYQGLLLSFINRMPLYSVAYFAQVSILDSVQGLMYSVSPTLAGGTLFLPLHATQDFCCFPLYFSLVPWNFTSCVYRLELVRRSRGAHCRFLDPSFSVQLPSKALKIALASLKVSCVSLSQQIFKALFGFPLLALWLGNFLKAVSWGQS